jgi:hypothetical protein
VNCIIILSLLALFARSGFGLAQDADQESARPHGDEWNQMLLAIFKGDMGPGGGWFKPSQTRYDWEWVLEHLDPARRGAISAKNSGLPSARFDRLDRDGDGMLTRADFDWSAGSPLAQKTMMARTFLMRADDDRDNKLSQKEWNALFQKMANGEKDIDLESVRKLIFPAMPPRPKGPPSDMPSTATLLKGFYRGELGSPFPGPSLGDFAPDFTLPGHDGMNKIRLRSYRGHKPVVLVFGSFT